MVNDILLYYIAVMIYHILLGYIMLCHIILHCTRVYYLASYSISRPEFGATLMIGYFGL